MKIFRNIIVRGYYYDIYLISIRPFTVRSASGWRRCFFVNTMTLLPENKKR